jgi:hypothetical protein
VVVHCVLTGSCHIHGVLVCFFIYFFRFLFPQKILKIQFEEYMTMVKYRRGSKQFSLLDPTFINEIYWFY